MTDRMTHLLQSLGKYNYLGVSRGMENEPRDDAERYVAFLGDRWLARGTLADVALAVYQHGQVHDIDEVAVLDESTGRSVELNVSGSEQEVRARYGMRPKDEDGAPALKRRRRGRPRLGVVGREVTLLPRHWAWLDDQRGGASATLRRLVDRARKELGGTDRRNQAQDRTHRLMTVLAGDRAGYEEACRALYGGDESRFNEQIRVWPRDVREVVQSSAIEAFRGPDLQ